MTKEEQLEFITLRSSLDDTLICSHATPEILNRMIDRYSILIDIFLKQYKGKEQCPTLKQDY